MVRTPAPRVATPQIHEDNGELSLHFTFPTIQSRMLKADPERLVLDYTRTMMGFLLFQSEPKYIAMIGLGGGSLAKYCRRKLPDTDFTAVEIDPDVIALRDTFGVPADSALFRIVQADGADFIQPKTNAFNVLLVDGFDPDGQPSQLCTIAFYDSCQRALRADGILVVNLCADDSSCNVYIDRIRTSFGERVIVVEADEGENMIVFAFKSGMIPLDLHELSKRLRFLEAYHPVDLDKTALKILRHDSAPRGQRKSRR